MPVEAEFAAAVTEARRGRGSVTFTAGGDERRWCAVIAAVDGALELRVGYPGRLARRRRSGALERLGWATAYDCWARPLPASTSESDAARELAAGLREGLHVPEDAELERVLVQTGGHALDLPDPGAPAEEQVAAVLRAVVRNGRGHAQI